jgi:hypothetical protein
VGVDWSSVGVDVVGLRSGTRTGALSCTGMGFRVRAGVRRVSRWVLGACGFMGCAYGVLLGLGTRSDVFFGGGGVSWGGGCAGSRWDTCSWAYGVVWVLDDDVARFEAVGVVSAEGGRVGAS